MFRMSFSIAGMEEGDQLRGTLDMKVIEVQGDLR